MKKILMVLAATLICGASVFTSCKKDEDNNLKLEEKIIGKWMQSEIGGQPALTNEKTVITILSTTKAYLSVSRSDYSSESDKWSAYKEYGVSIDGNKMTLTSQVNENKTLVNEYVVKSINGNEMVCDFRHTTIRNGEPNERDWQVVRYVKVTADYRAAIIGTWQGHCTSEGSVFDDGQEHRWQYNADGNFVYYVKDGDNWVPSANTLNQYFVDGNLLCTRWVDNGEEHREWWEITINGETMYWTALRQRADGTTYTATYEMSKIH